MLEDVIAQHLAVYFHADSKAEMEKEHTFSASEIILTLRIRISELCKFGSSNTLHFWRKLTGVTTVGGTEVIVHGSVERVRQTPN